MMELRKDGFKGQRSIILPEWVKEILKSNEITSSFYITDIGYYPNAQNHYRQRDEGCSENIFIYAIDGKGWIEVDGKKHSISSNEFFIIPQNTPHQYAADKHTPWSIYWIHFSGSKSIIVEPIMNRVCDISITNDTRIKERIAMFEEIYSVLEMGYSADNLEYVSIAAIHLLVSFKYTTLFSGIKKIETRNVIHDSIVFMRENVSRNLYLDEIAAHVGYSTSYFMQLFREKTNYSPLEYFTQLKMQQASQYLEFSDTPIKEIAFALGYNDPLYFTKVFNKHFGTPPSLFRRRFKVLL